MADLISFNAPHNVKRGKQPEPTQLDVLYHKLRRLLVLSPDEFGNVEFLVDHILKYPNTDGRFR